MPRTKRQIEAPAPATKEMEIGARIMARRKAIGMKRPELAERIGVKPNTIYRYEIGSIGISDSMKIEIAKVLGISMSYLVLGADGEDSGEHDISRQTHIPVIEQDVCDRRDFNWGNIGDMACEWFSLLPKDIDGPFTPIQPYIIKAADDSMTGVGIVKNSLVLVNPNTETRSGDIVFVRWNGRCSFKGIIYYQDGHIELRPANKDFSSVWIEAEEADTLQILGRAVRWIRMGVPCKIF